MGNRRNIRENINYFMLFISRVGEYLSVSIFRRGVDIWKILMID